MNHQYNDSELLYLIDEGNDLALTILYEKYKGLIHKRLNSFKIKDKNYEDFMQEGLMAMHVAINTYRPYSRKTFHKYYDLLLQRRIMNILRKEHYYFFQVVISDDLSEQLHEDFCPYHPVEEFAFKPLEEAVYDLLMKYHYRPTEIAKQLQLPIKKTYNVIYAVRKKIDKYNKK